MTDVESIARWMLNEIGGSVEEAKAVFAELMASMEKIAAEQATVITPAPDRDRLPGKLREP